MKNTSIIIAAISLFSPLATLAQSAPPATPIDGGLSILLAAGGAYGLKKLKDARKD